MSRASEVHVRAAGPVVVRRATGEADAAHLRATAQRLAEAAHPGVVELLRSVGSGDWWELELAHGGRPLEVLGAMTVEQVAVVTAGLAATVADLHAAGVVHGAIDPTHVLVSAHGRPVLCGFGPRAGDAPTPEDDVAAIGELMVTLLGDHPHLEPIPTRRWSRPARRDGDARRSLLLLSDHACAEPASRRPTAARLAAAIADAVPGVTGVAWPSESESSESEPSGPAGDKPDHAESRLPSLAAAALAVIVLAVMALTVVVPTVAGRPSRPVMASQPSPSSQRLPTTSTTGSTTSTTEAPSATPAVTTVVEDGRRYEVGEPGDVVVLGDWDGDGQRTAAVLRPSTGEVFVFTTWSTGDDVTVRAFTVIADGRDLAVVNRSGRDELIVLRGDGTQVPVPEMVA